MSYCNGDLYFAYFKIGNKYMNTEVNILSVEGIYCMAFSVNIDFFANFKAQMLQTVFFYQ